MRKLLVALLVSAPVACLAVSPDDMVASAMEAGLSTENMFDGNTLYELRGLPRFFEGYISGVADTGSMTPPAIRRYCMPAGVKVTQMADLTIKYLAENPARRHLGAAYLVRQAFREAWPCAPEPSPASNQPQRRQPTL